MMKSVYVLLVVGLMLAITSPATAEDFVCHSDERKQCGGTAGASNYIESQNPATFNVPGCTMIQSKPGSIAASQRALRDNVANSHPNGRCHLKVVDGLLVEMTTPEKTAVNTAIAADVAERDEYRKLVEENDLCNATRQELNTRKAEFLASLRVNIANIGTNAATNRQELDAVMVKIVNAMGKIVDCVRGRAGRPVE